MSQNPIILDLIVDGKPFQIEEINFLILFVNKFSVKDLFRHKTNNEYQEIVNRLTDRETAGLLLTSKPSYLNAFEIVKANLSAKTQTTHFDNPVLTAEDSFISALCNMRDEAVEALNTTHSANNVDIWFKAFNNFMPIKITDALNERVVFLHYLESSGSNLLLLPHLDKQDVINLFADFDECVISKDKRIWTYFWKLVSNSHYPIIKGGDFSKRIGMSEHFQLSEKARDVHSVALDKLSTVCLSHIVNSMHAERISVEQFRNELKDSDKHHFLDTVLRKAILEDSWVYNDASGQIVANDRISKNADLKKLFDNRPVTHRMTIDLINKVISQAKDQKQAEWMTDQIEAALHLIATGSHV